MGRKQKLKIKGTVATTAPATPPFARAQPVRHAAEVADEPSIASLKAILRK
jgi:hypothetical protein